MGRSKPAIIVVSSHVVRGTVGNRAAAFALEVMGYPVWIVPTITLPWHPGHGPATRIVPPQDAFENLLKDLTAAPWLSEVAAVLTGYLGAVDQVGPVADLVRAVKAKNPDALYALDPVLGDAGRLYVSKAQADAIRTTLLPLADLVTPNPFELGFLAQTGPAPTNEELLAAAKKLNVPTTMVTSAEGLMKGTIANLLVDDGTAYLAEHRSFDGPPNGLGDLAAALMLGNMLNGMKAADALERSSASLCEVMITAARAGSDELLLEACLPSLLKPREQVNVRLLA